MFEKSLGTKAIEDVLMSIGIYPAATIKNYGTKEQEEIPRTEKQEGWNDCLIEITKRIFDSLDRIDKGEDNNFAILSLLELGRIDGDKFVINLNDTFFYACADNEEISKEEAKEVIIMIKKYGDSGLIYWIAKKRNYDPEIPEYKALVEKVRAEEENIGS